MLKKIHNFTHKSFKNYTGPDEEFRNVNVIFGYNGTGKTALVKGIKEEFLKKNDIDDLRIFSKEYVANSLLLDESNREKLKGIKATFGEVDVGVEKEIKELEEKLIPLEEIEKAKTKNEELEQSIKKEIEDIFKSKKGKLNIQGKSNKLSIDEIIEKYKSDYENALKVEPNKINIKNAIGDDTIEKKILNIESLYKQNEINFPSTFFSDLEEFQNRKFIDIEIPSSHIINWLSDGLQIHANKEKCEFCGAPINYFEIKQRVSSYTGNIRYEAEKFFINQAHYLSDILNNLKIFVGNKDKYINLLGDIISKYFILMEENIKFIEKAKEIFKYNFENITSIIKVDIKELQDKLKIINENINKINSFRSKNIEEENIKLSKLGIIVKGAVYLDIEDSTFIKNCLNSLKLNKQFIANSEKENNEFIEKIKKLKESKSVASDFMELVNDTLDNLGISLKLEIEYDDYILKTRLFEKEQLTIDDISEGEKNLLSLLFFYYEIFEDRNQEKVKDNIKLIILDDPISSMDDSNRFYVLEIVQSLTDLDIEQIFVLTHVWDDFSQLIYGKKSFIENSKYASFEIRKDEFSYLVKNISKGSPYKHMFKEVYNLSKEKKLSSDCDYYHMPNVIRKVFEEFLFFKTHKSTPQRSNKKHIEQIFKINTIKDKRDLGTLLSVINVLSHTNTKTNDDILIAAKCLMKIIKENDELHYNTMKE